jgi:hypothetical protein
MTSGSTHAGSPHVLHRYPYRQSLAEREELEEQIRKLIANGWVTKSNNRFAALTIFIKRPDGRLRICVVIVA